METPLHEFAGRHDGVVTADAAQALGYTGARLRAVVAVEGWARIAPCAYLAPGEVETLRARVRAAQLRHRPLVASHRTALGLHVEDWRVERLEFTAPGSARYDVPDGNFYRWRLGPDDTLDLDGLRVTTPARTAADLLRALPAHDAVCAADTLLREGLVDLPAVAAALDKARGTRHIRRAWTSYARLDPRSGSVAESKARLVLADAGLRPRSQPVLIDRIGQRVRVDFWFPAGVAVEIEGYAFHATRERHGADIARFNDLARLADVTVLRFSWADVFARSAAMVATVRAALAARERAAAPNTVPTGEYVLRSRGDW